MRTQVDPAADQARLDRWLATLPRALRTLDGLTPSAAAAVDRDYLEQQAWPAAMPTLARASATLPAAAPGTAPWWASEGGHVRARGNLSAATLELVGALARVHGELLVRTVPGASWVIWDWVGIGEEAEGDGDYAVTVANPSNADGYGDVVFPLRDITVIVQRTLNGPPESGIMARLLDLRLTALRNSAGT